MPPRIVKPASRQLHAADYQSFDDDYNRPANANPLPFARVLLFISILFTAATVLAIFAQMHRESLLPPPASLMNESSSSSSTGAAALSGISSLSAASGTFVPSVSSSSSSGSVVPLVSSSSSSYSTGTAALVSSSSSSSSGAAYNGTVHVVFSNHLDIGFANSSVNIVNEYFDKYFPAAINFTQQLRAIDYKDGYTWMTHTYLLSLYFDCPPNMGLHCPTAQQQQDLRYAIADGSISFHAFPFNSEMELHTVELVEAGIQLSVDLAKTLGRVGGPPTVISQRDVPGTTIGIVPTLAKHGIRAFSIGANEAASPANVSRVSRWQVGSDSIYLLFHGGNYGGIGLTDAVVLPGFNHVLLMDWRVDNSGPETDVAALTQQYDQIRGEFPGYNVVPSTFESYLDELDKAVAAGTVTLPVVTDEMGDTWMYGAGSDPIKTSEWIVLQRLHAECVHNATCDSDSYAFHNFTRLLLKGGEHTWGGDHKTYLQSWVTCADGAGGGPSCPYFAWNNSEFATILDTPQYQSLLYTFVEQRLWSVDIPLSALPPSHPIAQQAPAYFAQLRPAGAPSLDGYTRTANVSFSVGNMTAHVSPYGGLDGVSLGGRPLSNVYAPFATLRYQLFDETSYLHFEEAYMNCDIHDDCTWANNDYGKPYLDQHSRLGEVTLQPVVTGVYVQQLSDTVLSILTNATFDSAVVDYHALAGTPAQVWSEYRLDAAASSITVSLTLIDKTATRIPEALWLVFNSTAASPFLVNKLGVTIDPRHVAYNGSAHLHGTVYETRNELMAVHAHNAPFLCLGSTTTPFPTPMSGLDSAATGSGLSYNLLNNVWGTNYPLAYPFLPETDSNLFFSFEVQFTSA